MGGSFLNVFSDNYEDLEEDFCVQTLQGEVFADKSTTTDDDGQLNN